MWRFVLLAVLTTGCVRQQPPPGSCPRADAMLRVDSGTLTWSLRESAGTTSLATGGTCQVAFASGAAWRPGQTNAKLIGRGHIGCRLPKKLITVSIRDLDIVELREGEYVLPIKYAYHVPVESEHRACELDAVAKLVVQHAAGGASPVPSIVTGDFARKIIIEIDNREMRGISRGPWNRNTTCSPLTFTARLEVSMTARDVVSKPDTACPGPYG